MELWTRAGLWSKVCCEEGHGMHQRQQDAFPLIVHLPSWKRVGQGPQRASWTTWPISGPRGKTGKCKPLVHFQRGVWKNAQRCTPSIRTLSELEVFRTDAFAKWINVKLNISFKAGVEMLLLILSHKTRKFPSGFFSQVSGLNVIT